MLYVKIYTENEMVKFDHHFRLWVKVIMIIYIEN